MTLATPAPDPRLTLARTAWILADEGHESGLAGQITVRGPRADTYWTLPLGLGFEEAGVASMLLLDDEMNVLEGEGAFGVREPAVILVRGERPDDVEAAAGLLAEALRSAPSIVRVMDRAPAPVPPADPTLAWAYAGPAARARLATAVTPDGMRARLAETRAMLLAPASDVDVEAWLARDPLRLSQVPWEARAELAAGVPALPGGPFVADGGRARLVIAQPRGSAFASADARALVEVVGRAEAAVASAGLAGVTMELSGGHAIAWATEQMLRTDLEVSGTLSIVLASLAFVATFRRARACISSVRRLIPSALTGR